MQITDDEKQRVLNYLKNRFKVLKGIIATLEKDIKSQDPDVQATALYVAGQYLAISTQFFKDVTDKEQK